MKSKKIINFAITMGKKHKRLIYNALGLTLIIFFYSVFFQATYCWMRFGSPTFNGDWGSFIYSLPFNFVPFLIIAIAALWSVWFTRNIAVLWKKITLDLLMASCIVIIVNILFLLTTGLEINWGGTVFNGIMIWMGIEFWAVSLQRQRALIRESLLLKENAAAIIAGISVGTLVSLGSVLALALAMGLTREQYATLLPKSVTTAISMDVAAELGGIAALTGAIVILTGIAGNLLAEVVCKIFHITDPIAKGVGIGTSAHAVGTSKALQMGEVEGAMSGLSIAVAGVLTAVLCPFFVSFIQ